MPTGQNLMPLRCCLRMFSIHTSVPTSPDYVDALLLLIPHPNYTVTTAVIHGELALPKVKAREPAPNLFLPLVIICSVMSLLRRADVMVTSVSIDRF